MSSHPLSCKSLLSTIRSFQSPARVPAPRPARARPWYTSASVKMGVITPVYPWCAMKSTRPYA